MDRIKITAELTDSAVLRALGARLGRERLEANMTQGALAERAGVSKRTVERLEAGRGCELSTLIRVLRVLGLSDGVDGLIPERPPSPIRQLESRGKQRRRATSKPAPARGKAWSWRA